MLNFVAIQRRPPMRHSRCLGMVSALLLLAVVASALTLGATAYGDGAPAVAGGLGGLL